ncbi:MAG: diguanylate cyclase [Natronospirillum sp.]|uniref:sensor domain-containing diguanylate cyclase n=1 Tax=Natronospirillum sp. TaxID=2812955 RepID=UPI0025CCA277|nr:diguanylate cyclase [Natronospirillum sp.]MCH8550835.1 diguanylate cyclase [Natronospirillum sp.]
MGLTLTLAVYVLQSRLVATEFNRLEETQAVANTNRVLQRFDILLETIDFTVYDWSAWSDTYQFAEDRNQGYIDSNLYPATFENYGTDVVAFVDLDLNVLWARVFDFSPGAPQMDLTDAHLDDLLQHIADFVPRISPDVPMDERYHSGLFQLNEMPVMFSMRPIVQSSSIGVANGYLLLGTTINPTLVEAFSWQVSVDFEIGPLVSHAALTENAGFLIERPNRELLVASEPYLSGHEGGFIVTTYLPRDITLSGAQTLQQVITAFVLVCLLAALVTWWVLRRHLVTPLQSLTSEIQQITSTGNYAKQSTLQSNDEIGQLAGNFNNLLRTVDKKHQELSELNTKLNKEHARLISTQQELQRANFELKSLSEKDALTGLYNRLALDRKLEWDWAILGRAGAPLSILLIDIDLFKQYNDHYGHQAGDDCLRRVAIAMESVALRDSDMVARYGGEEFIVLLPNTAKDAAIKLANRLLQVIKDEAIEHQHSPIEKILTVSIGVASAVPQKDHSVKSLVDAADKALYRAKENGRGRVENGSTV